MEKENSNPPMDHKSKEEAVTHDAMAPDVVETVVGGLPTPEFVDGSKQKTVVRDAASSSADTVETGTENAMTFWDEVDKDGNWMQEEDLHAPQDVEQAVNPWLDFLMAAATPETAALLRTIHANTNIFNVGAYVNANNQFAAQTRTEASATARPSAPVNSTIFEGSTEEEDGNEWYMSLARDAQRLEQMEDPELQELFSPLRLPEAPPKEEHCGGHKRPSAGEDGRELTLEDYYKIWGVHPSELDSDEPGPSTKMQGRVPPLADDEITKFDCGICLETLPILDLFHGMQCDHMFCAPCMATYIEGRIRDGAASILCPDPACKEAAGEGNNGGVLNPEHCKKSIDFAAFCSWGERLTEKAIPQDQRTYCPNPRCALMLERTFSANRAPCKAPCPACKHPMCTTCGLGWVIEEGRDDDHHNCDEGKGAALVKELAAQRRWKQCPSCKMMVEKIMGCNTMHCRCGILFCYSCGRRMARMDAGQDEAELCQCRYNVHVNVNPRLRGRRLPGVYRQL